MSEQSGKKLNSRQRAYLIGLAADMTPELQVGKNGVSPESVESLEELFNNRELVKGNILKNCPEVPAVAAEMLASRTHAEVIKVIGRKFVLYRKFKDEPRIILPK